MAKKLKTYDLKQVNVIFNGRIISGAAETDFVTVEMNEDAWTHHTGADGEEARSRTNNNSGKVTVKLSQYAEDNRTLSEFHEADKASGAGIGSLLVVDKSGFSIHATDEAYIAKAPTAGYGKTPGDREWVFNCASMKHFVGGN
jgi:Protein of unknown function (DUF3277)